MLLSKIVSIVVSVLILSLQTRAQQSAGQASQQADNERNKHVNFNRIIPFQDLNGLIIIQVTIQGKNYNFVFDTGAPTIISEELADELGLEELGKAKLADGDNNSNTQKVYKINSIRVADISFINSFCVSANTKKISEQICTNIDGIIGANLMRECYWKINYNENTITLSNTSLPLSSTAKILKFKEGVNGSPYVKIQCGDSLLDIEFDTGSNGPVRLSDSIWFNSPEAKHRSYATVYGILEQTVYNKFQSTEYMSLANSLLLDGRNFENIVVNARDMKGQIQTIGSVFMKNYEVTLNWKDHLIYLDPVNNPSETNTLKTIGLSVTKENKKLLVSNIWKGSKADQEGVKPGDQIIEINGIKTKKISQDDYCKIKNDIKNSAQVTITIKTVDNIEKEIVLDRYEPLSN